MTLADRSKKELSGRCWLPVYVFRMCFYCNAACPGHTEDCKVLHKETSTMFAGKDQTVFVPEGGL